jgi:hypothetical protein
VTATVMASVQGVVNSAISAEHARMVELLLPEVLGALRHEISDEICSAIETAYQKAFADVRGLVRLFEEPIVSVTLALGFSSDDF